MAESDYDIQIKLGTTYDPKGEQEAQAGIERIKQAQSGAGALPQPGDTVAGGEPGGSSGAAEALQQAATEATASLVQLGEAGQAAGQQVAEGARQAGERLTEEATDAESLAEAYDTLTTARGEEASAAEAQVAAQVELTRAGEAHVGGLNEEAAATEQVQAAQDAATVAQKKLTEAKTREKRATEEVAAAERKLQREMELAKKARNELIRELQRLAKERQAAAKAGDEEKFQQLTQQSAEVREAFEKLNQGLELTNIQFTQQAQMGMMAGQTLAGLGEAAMGGSKNIAGMAASVLSLGQAIKAGLGPVGWAMMILQGLQTAWNMFSEAEKKAAETAREAKKAYEELQKTLFNLAKAATDARMALEKNAHDEAERERKAEAEREMTALERRHERERSASEQRLELLRQEVESTQTLTRAKYEAGLITEAEYNAQMEQEESRLRSAEQAAAESEEKRQQERLRKQLEGDNAALEAKRGHLEQMAQTYGNTLVQWERTEHEEEHYRKIVGRYEQLQKVIEARKAAVDTINKEMEAEKAGADRDDVLAGKREERARLEKEIALYEGQVKDLHWEAEYYLSGVTEAAKKQAEARDLAGVELLKYAWHISEQAEIARDEVAQAERDAEATQEAMGDVSRLSSARKERADKEEELRTLAEEEAALKRKAEQREQEWAAVMEKGLATQKAWLEEQMQQMAEGSELRKEYSLRLKAVNEALAAERVAEVGAMEATRRYAVEDTRTQQEIYDADRALLQSKIEKLRAELASGENLTPELRMQIGRQIAAAERQLLGLAQTELREQLREVTASRTTGQYKTEDRRTQRQILEADRAILQRREQELQELLNNPELDSGTRQQINAALKDTRNQMRGLAQATERNRQESEKWLRELQPPQFRAANKLNQRRLDAAGKAYARMAQQAQKAAARGDTKTLERYNRSLQQRAKIMDRLAGGTGQALRMDEQTRDHLKSQVRTQQRSAAASKRSEKAERDKAKANEQAAAQAKKNAREARRNGPEAKVAQLTADVSALKTTLAATESKIGQLNAELAGLTAAANAMAAAAGAAASAAAAAKAQLQGQINNIRKEIDRIRR